MTKFIKDYFFENHPTAEQCAELAKYAQAHKILASLTKCAYNGGMYMEYTHPTIAEQSKEVLTMLGFDIVPVDVYVSSFNHKEVFYHITWSNEVRG